MTAIAIQSHLLSGFNIMVTLNLSVFFSDKKFPASKGFCGCHFEPAIDVEMSKL
jgi:hypothetical protein